MARTVFLHVGAMKSATTYLQEFFDRNADRLLLAGLLWPGSGENFKATDDLLDLHRDWPGHRGAWKTMKSRIADHPGNVLISNELLAAANLTRSQRLMDALAPARVEVVITARDLARVIPSQWQEGVRNRQTITWQEFLAAVRGDEGCDREVAKLFWRKQGIAALVRRWSRVVPLADITVVTVPAPGGPTALLAQRFASVIGVNVDGFKQPRYQNPSMEGIASEFLRRVNERSGELGFLQYRWGIKHALGRFTLPNIGASDRPLLLRPQELAWVRARAIAMVDAIVESGVTVVGDVSDLIPAETTKTSQRDPTAATDDQIHDVAMTSVVALARMLANVRIEYDALVHALDHRMPQPTPREAEQFTAWADSRPDVARGMSPKGRRLRWQLTHTDAQLTPKASNSRAIEADRDPSGTS